jgi:hypothetical protein
MSAKFQCDPSCECGNQAENWNHCVKCDAMECDMTKGSPDFFYNEAAETWLCPACFESQKNTVDGLAFMMGNITLAGGAAPAPSDIEGLIWSDRFGPADHMCDPKYNADCAGQKCQYNALCAAGGCDRVLSDNAHIFCLERAGKEITVCSSCYEDMKEAMLDEGGWTVDGEECKPDTTPSDGVARCAYGGEGYHAPGLRQHDAVHCRC